MVLAQMVVFAMRYAFVLALLLLAGCATMQEQAAPTATIGGAFQVSGRVSVKYGTEAASGKIDWRHDAEGDDMLISNPLGQGVARIERQQGRVRLTTSEQKMYQAEDVEALTERVLGWRLPLAGLPDWVRGRAAPGAPAQTRPDGAARLAELRQSGWIVEFLEFDGNGLPARLRMSRDDVEIRLVIDQWRNAQ